jgi:hypothetical protein
VASNPSSRNRDAVIARYSGLARTALRTIEHHIEDRIAVTRLNTAA